MSNDLYLRQIYDAIKNGADASICEMLLQSDDGMYKMSDYTNPKDGSSLLHMAVMKNNEAIVNMLFDTNIAKNRTNVDYQDDGGQTPLHYAVKDNNINIATILLKNGARANRRDFTGKSPLEYAIDLNYVEMIALLNPPKAEVLDETESDEDETESDKNNKDEVPKYSDVVMPLDQNVANTTSNTTSNTTGQDNVGVGHNALLNNTTGIRNTGVGYQSMVAKEVPVESNNLVSRPFNIRTGAMSSLEGGNGAIDPNNLKVSLDYKSSNPLLWHEAVKYLLASFKINDETFVDAKNANKMESIFKFLNDSNIPLTATDDDGNTVFALAARYGPYNMLSSLLNILKNNTKINNKHRIIEHKNNAGFTLNDIVDVMDAVVENGGRCFRVHNSSINAFDNKRKLIDAIAKQL